MIYLEGVSCGCCGAPIDASGAEGKTVRCIHCGYVLMLPREDNPAALSFMRQGEHELDVCRFEDAFAAYKKAAEIDEKEPEAQFGMALAEFKVRYLRDHVRDCMQPICQRPTRKKFAKNAHYLKAIELATAEQRKEYERRAGEIDYIAAEFYRLEQSGLRYDCFLCVKVRDDVTHAYTEDSKDADYIYRLLQDNGFRPFYSERELRGKVGTDYEAHILYALAKSECMLLVCRKEEYLRTPWVRNEYARYLKFIESEEKEKDSLTVVFYDEAVDAIPGRAGKIQGIDFSKRDADGKVVKFVDAHTPEAKRRREEENLRRQKETETRYKADMEQIRKQLLEELQKEKTPEKPSDNSELEALKAQIAELKKEKAAPKKKAADNSELEALKAQIAELQKEKAAPQTKAADNSELEALKAQIAELQKEKAAPKKKKAGAAADLSPADVLAMMRKAEADEKAKQEAAEEKKRERARLRAMFDVKAGVLKKFKGLVAREEIKLPGSVKEIKDGAFLSASLKGIEIPAGTTKIEPGAFACSRIEHMTVAEGNDAYYVKNECLIEKETGRLLWAHTEEIPEEVKEIARQAFHLYFAHFVIPAGVTKIEPGAFAGVNVSSIKVARGNKFYSADGKNLIEKGTKKLVFSIDKSVPDGVKEIGADVFARSKVLYLTLPDSVVKVGDGAFTGSELRSIDLGKGTEEIGDRAFDGCRELVSVKFGPATKTIGDKVFCGCVSLPEVVIPLGTERIGADLFGESDEKVICKSLKYFELPKVLDGKGEGKFDTTAFWRIHTRYVRPTDFKIVCKLRKKK